MATEKIVNLSVRDELDKVCNDLYKACNVFKLDKLVVKEENVKKPYGSKKNLR